MKLLSYLFPQTLYRGSSRYNADIKIVEINGKPQLIVNGIQQTGPYDEKIFRSAFRLFDIEHRAVHSSLLMGLGGGFVVKLLHKSFPETAITCVDIDNEMVVLSQKYFELDSIPCVTYRVANAKEYVRDKQGTYDLIVLDLYVGDEVPTFIEDTSFLESLFRLFSPHGALLINYQAHPRYAARSEQLRKQLERVFSSAQERNIGRNTFFFAQC